MNEKAKRKWPRLRFQGATLVETLVSLSLISITFVVGTLIWLQLNGYGAPDRTARYRMIAGSLIDHSERKGEFGEKLIEFEGVKFFRKVRVLNSESSLYQLRVECMTAAGKPLFERSKIIRHHAP